MIAVFDASVLVYLFDPDAHAPSEGNEAAVERCGDRVSLLIGELQRIKARIVIPAPALAEILVYAGSAAPEWLRTLSTSRHFRIAPFDALAAVEYAAMEAERLATGRRSQATRAKVKFDQQIVAIARVAGATLILSDDDDIRKLTGDTIEVQGVGQLPLPSSDGQIAMIFDEPIESTE